MGYSPQDHKESDTTEATEQAGMYYSLAVYTTVSPFIHPPVTLRWLPSLEYCK